MTENHSQSTSPSNKTEAATRRRRRLAPEARATAQRAKLDARTDTRAQQQDREAAPPPSTQKSMGKQDQRRLIANRRASTTIASAIEDYLQDHAGGTHSAKTLEWHRTALSLLRTYLQEERYITLIGEVDAPDISAWFASMRTSPSTRGKVRSERTIQTYARSARAFFHWLVHRGTLASNPFDRVTFPKVGKPLIQTIEAEEFERLLLACTPSNGSGPIADRAGLATGPSSGCSTTPAFAFPSCDVNPFWWKRSGPRKHR